MRTTFEIPGFGEVVGELTTGREKIDRSPRPGLLGVHKVLGGGKGYSITHLPSGLHVLWTRLQGTAKGIQRKLEALDWDDEDLTEVRGAVEKYRAANLP